MTSRDVEYGSERVACQSWWFKKELITGEGMTNVQVQWEEHEEIG